MNEAEIDAMFGDGEQATVRSPAPSMLAQWRRVAQFVRWPALPATPLPDARLMVIARVFALDLALMAVLVTAAFIAQAAGFRIAPTALSEVEFTPLIIATVIIGAPVMEEIAFRGWLSGRPGHILALLSFAAGIGAFATIAHGGGLTGGAFLIAGALGAVAALVLLRGHPPMRWFAAIFPAFFWASTLAFALVHLANFSEGSLGTILPLVLPQFVLGALLAYLRVEIGLWAAIVLHGAHNATALGLAALALTALRMPVSG